MKAVFLASHSQKSMFIKDYEKIRDWLVSHDYKLYTGKLFEDLDHTLEDEEERISWYKESISEVRSTDIVVIEISHPSSANIGHILTCAIEFGKPVIALYKKGRDPIFLRGWRNEKFLLLEYFNDVEEVLDYAVKYAIDQQDTRFNFFVSPTIVHYLDEVSKKKRLPRAVYLRRLIEEDMKNNQEYEKE